MFSITVLAVGKLKEKFYTAAAAEYAKRLQGYCRFELVELPESVEEIGIRIVEEDETEGQEPPALVDTFAGCPLLQVKAVPDSYAGAYAAEHQIPVIFEEE